MAIVSSATPLVQLKHVTKSFGPVQVLKDVSLEMSRGEVLCLAGENGAGKSTLIKILTGAIQRDGGEYLIDGQDVGSPSPSQARALGVGVVYQELSLLPEVSVEENLLMGRLPASRTRAATGCRQPLPSFHCRAGCTGRASRRAP